MMTSGKIAVSFDEESSPYPHQIPSSRESQVTSCGFGFICIKNGVFEKMPKPWFDSRIFEKNGRLTAGIGEDSSWCIRVRELGFKIWLDPNVRVIHNKTMALTWDK
jgi:GT2 family glycosyltransferase